jgi:hypothetical protein
MPKICEYENCRFRASYGATYGNGIRCKVHKENYKPQLSICHCGSAKPSFNINGFKPEYCIKCKKDDMINVIHKVCECGSTRPIFNLDGLSPRYCVKCKTNDMVDVVSKKCYCGKAQPHFNIEGDLPEYCSDCKKEGMVDVSNKKCFCGKMIPRFNLEGKKASYCSDCKTEEMVDVKCKMCICGKALPSFNYLNLVPQYCRSCKKDGMIDLKNKRCKANLCLGTRGNTKYKGYCANCYQNLFPNDPLTIQMRCKTKEIAVRDYINSNFSDFNHDTVLWTGNCDCNHRRRIDHRKLIGNTLLCIETDENQHKYYRDNNENIRYDDLFMIHGGKFIFIRFNPDKYINSKGETINTLLFKRLSVLGNEIKKQIVRINNEENKELVEIIRLFYDEKLENKFIDEKDIEKQGHLYCSRV